MNNLNDTTQIANLLENTNLGESDDDFNNSDHEMESFDFNILEGILFCSILCVPFLYSIYVNIQIYFITYT